MSEQALPELSNIQTVNMLSASNEGRKSKIYLDFHC